MKRRLGADSKKPVLLLSARLVIPVTGPAIADGAVAVQGARVLHVGTRQWVSAKLREELEEPALVHERPWHGIITPGLVNAHTHLEYTGMQSVGQRSYPTFRQWELAFNKIYDSPEKKPWKAWSHEGARQLVRAGTTAAADIVSDVEAADALASQGLHGISYWEVMDWNNKDWKARGAETLLANLDACEAEGATTLGISPHAPYSLGSEPLLDLPDIARSCGMRLHLHLAETPLEAGDVPDTLSNLVSSRWNRTAWTGYRELDAAGAEASAIQFADELGELGPDMHIAHGVYASAEDRRILRQRGVAVALCPRSNRIVSSGIDAPVAAYLKEGNLLAVGTDSLSSAPTLDVLDDLSLLFDIARSQGYEEPDLSHRLIRMATLGGAEALGLNVGPGRIGQINAGALADLALFDISVDVSAPQGIEEAFEAFVREGAGTCCATYIAGRLAYER
ncbi:MAG: amidohydrolase family protein [Atopobiaceae bacterium]